MTVRTPAQKARQDKAHRSNGRYSVTNPCYRCGKSAGIDYFSFLADRDDDNGNHWGDRALCVCERCGAYLESLDHASAWAEAQSDAWGSLPKGRAP